MYGLDLFSGIGGITKALEGYVCPVAYCENNRYAQGVLLSRMATKDLPSAPIWEDVRTLSGEMLPSGIDIIYGGFPCQDISVAGRGEGLGGKRSGLFFEIVRLVSEIRPRFVFLENVSAITVRGSERVVGELCRLGYDCRWGVLSASDVGATHRRDRWWLLAHAQHTGMEGRRRTSDIEPNGEGRTGIREPRLRVIPKQEKAMVETRGRTATKPDGESQPGVLGMVDGVSGKLDCSGGMGHATTKEKRTEEIMSYLQETDGAKILQWATGRLDHFQATEVLLSYMREYEKGSRLPRQFLESATTPEGIMRAMWKNKAPSRSSHRLKSLEQFAREHPDAMWELSQLVASRSEPKRVVGRGEVPLLVDRLRGLGNAVVPAQAREAFERLMGLK